MISYRVRTSRRYLTFFFFSKRFFVFQTKKMMKMLVVWKILDGIFADFVFCSGAGGRVTASLVPPDSDRLCPEWLFVHCRTSPCISPLSPVPTPKTPVPPSSQPKGLLFVHCRTSPSRSPLSPVPTPKTPVPPVPNLKGCLFIVEHLQA